MFSSKKTHSNITPIRVFHVLFFVLFFHWSCIRNDNQENPIQFSYASDTLDVSFQKPEFVHFSAIDNTLYCIFKEPEREFLNIVQIANLFEPDSVKQIYLPELNISNDALGYMKRIIMFSEDSILFIQKKDLCSDNSYRLSVYDLQHNKLVYVRNYTEGIDGAPDYIINDNTCIVKNHNRLYFILHKIMMDPSDMRFCGFVDFDTGIDSILPITLPEEYHFKDNEVNPFWNVIYLTTDNSDNLVFSFGISPTIIKYNIKSGLYNEFFVKNYNYRKSQSLNTNGDVIDYTKIQRIIECSYLQSQIHFDKKNKVFYRFFDKEMPDKDNNGYLTDYKTQKEKGISIISETMDILGDVLFDLSFNSFLHEFSTVTDEGLIFLQYNKEKNKIIRHKIHFKL